MIFMRRKEGIGKEESPHKTSHFIAPIGTPLETTHDDL